ncbi:hypothetical protein SAMN04487948_105138 [Halogranum amylolyticum]|uniref:Uncharacterized protein n=1 Tax=Halogranum amylolyticum TaxID=660520 RepID=A0A1H8SKD0_9EURY|nr:hypothetical protein [Halogranum amylolyticum]SEO78728.1 hypothetical protein SAMN04487948_105138 [Halogranum amylolyticum]
MNPITLLARRLGSESDAAYECERCGTRHRVQYHVCPVCGSFSVETETRERTWVDERSDERQTG